MVIVKLKRHKSPGIDQMPKELIKAGGGAENFLIPINLLISFRIRSICQRSGRR
jgi:hypothetical protein